MKYKIVRFFSDTDKTRTIKSNVSKEYAIRWCRSKFTMDTIRRRDGSVAEWFDGFQAIS